MKQIDWKPVGSISLENNAEKAVKSIKNVLVVAGPGAGKTELLIQKADYLFKINLCRYPQKILVLTFKKDACLTIQKRFSAIENPAFVDRFVVKTYDAFSKSLLDSFRLALNDLFRPEKDYLIDNKIIEEACKEVRVSKEQYKRWLNCSDDLDLSKNDFRKLWQLLIKGFNGHKASLTFNLICKLAILIIKNNPKIKKALQLTYANVFLDEFQDTTELQYQLIKECFLNSNSTITAVGDPKQRIMLWAGAFKNVFEKFKEDFNAEQIELIMNHRSTNELVNLQYEFYYLLGYKRTSGGIAYKSENIKWYQCGDEEEEAVNVAKDISFLKECGYKENEICILFRSKVKNNSTKIIKALQDQNIYSRVEEEYQKLRGETVVAILLSFMKLAIFERSQNDWEYLVNQMVGIKKLSYYSDSDAYKYLINNIENMIKIIKRTLPTIKSKGQLDKLLKDILNFVGVEKIISNFGQYHEESFLKNIINSFLELIFKEYNRTKYDWQKAILGFEGENSIPIMSIHKSKGLEFRVIYLIGLEVENFFGLKDERKIEKVDEELSTIFVGISRAKEKLIITTSNKRDNRSTRRIGTKMDDVFNILNRNAIKV